MKILNKDLTEIGDVLLMLTPEEAWELASKVEDICKNPDKADHIHVNDIDFKKEITVAINTPKNMKHFGKDIQRILASDD